MYKVQFRKKARKFIDGLPKKHRRQVNDYILDLCDNPKPQDSKELTGYKPYLRGDVGEYRIIYKYETHSKLITVAVIGKRNGGEVYKKMGRIL